MSKALFVCMRDPANHESVRCAVQYITERLGADNISSNKPLVSHNNGVVIGVSNPSSSIMVTKQSLALGNLVNPNGWDIPKSPVPDGTFALFRSNKTFIEVLSDVVASRTIWYVKNQDLFVASTSQRAIVSLIGGFHFNEAVIPWVLSTGTLGPGQGWDTRISRLDGDSSLLLNRSTWDLSVKTNEVIFSPTNASDHEHYQSLKTTVENSMAEIDLDKGQWVLPLSGGYDSRSILCLLLNQSKPKTITWGVKSAMADAQGDAVIAKKLATHFSLDHHYFETDTNDDSIETIFDRFFRCGEGRVDHVSAYMDGFKLWKTLFDMGVSGIIRGDLGFSSKYVISPLDARVKLGIPLWTDFSNLPKLSSLGFDKSLDQQSLPAYLDKQKDETYDAWRDRLYHQFRLPIVIASLNDIKSPYLEIQNPLLLKKIVYQIRSLPDHLRTGKALYKKIVLSVSPDIPFAKRASTQSKNALMDSPRVTQYLRRELSNRNVDLILPRPFVDYILNRMTDYPAKQSRASKKFRRVASKHSPEWLADMFPSIVARPVMDMKLLAFRVLMICHITKILVEDGASVAEVLRGCE